MSNKVEANYNINNSAKTLIFKKRVESIRHDRTPYQKLERVYRSQGVIGKTIDGLKGIIGLEYTHTNLLKDIKRRNVKDIDSKLNKYYDRQKNETEIVVDVGTGIASAWIFRLARKAMAYSHAYLPKGHKIEKISLFASAGISALSGMIMKPILKGLNSLGTPSPERKKERTAVKDMTTGLIDGLMSPVMYLHKAGILAAAGVNSLSRFIFNKKADKDSNLGEHLSLSWVIKLPLIGIAGFSVFKHHKGIDKVEKAIIKSKENVKDIKNWGMKMPMSELIDLGKYSVQDKTSRNGLIDSARRGYFSKLYVKLTKPFDRFRHNSTKWQLREVQGKALYRMLLTKDKEILRDSDIEKIMREIEQYNIFFPKMIQSLPSNIAEIGKTLSSGENSKFMESLSSSDKNGYKEDKLIKKVNTFLNNYKSKCPSSRTVSEAQELVSKSFGNKYKIQGKEPIGVGTIAESYLAKDSSGKEVVIKMTKKWATESKINQDKENMLSLLKRMKNKMTEEEYNYQCNLVENLYKAWSKEVDMQLEADAAITLGKYAQHYNTVAPVEVKNNIFVMEKANGVQFDKFVEFLKKNNKKLTKDELMELSIKYMQVFMEQLLSVPKNGNKVMHADPHVGNIFIDINNKEKPFTFIDTGNVMRFTPEEAIANLTSHIDYFIGNSKSIAQKLIKGAKLPAGMSEKQAVEMLAKHIQQTFFSGKYAAKGGVDPFSAINNEAMEFMKKNHVIINPQNSNLTKAEWTYILNLVSLNGIQNQIDLKSILNEERAEQLGKLLTNQVKDSIINGAVNNKEATIKELKTRIKFINENPEDFFTSLYSWVKPKNS